MKKSILILLLFSIFFTISNEAYGQRKKKKRRETTKTEQVERIQSPLIDKLNYEMKLGNISFFSGLRIAAKGSVGFKPTNFLTAGLAAKIDYTFINNPNTGVEDISFSHYGLGPFLRLKFLESFYVQAEYDYNFMAEIISSSNGSFLTGERLNAGSPLIGGGYMSGFGPWMYGVEIFFITNDIVRNNMNTAIEYWFGVSYNF